MATWPTYATIAADGFWQRRESAVLRTDMESGPPKQAKIKSRVMVTLDAKVYIQTLADYNSFITWFNTQINRGADWFDWLDPVSKTIKQARIVNGQIDTEYPRVQMRSWVLQLKLESWDA